MHPAPESPMRKKPLLSFWQLWNMSFGYVGIQFGFALQNANVSRIFETLGAKVDEIPILWIAGPVSGLLVQPVIGYMSDKTWNRLGRRKPYFLVGAILASLALPGFDQVLKTTRTLDRRFTALGAPMVALHAQLVLPLPRNPQVRELIFNPFSHII